MIFVHDPKLISSRNPLQFVALSVPSRNVSLLSATVKGVSCPVLSQSMCGFIQRTTGCRTRFHQHKPPPLHSSVATDIWCQYPFPLIICKGFGESGRRWVYMVSEMQYFVNGIRFQDG